MQRHTEGKLRELGRKVYYVIVYVYSYWQLLSRSSSFWLPSKLYFHTLKILLSMPLNKVVTRSVGEWLGSYKNYLWKYFGPFFAYLGMFLSLWGNYFRWYTFYFWSSILAILGQIGTVGFTLFPFIIPSSTNPSQSLTVWNSASSQYSLNVTLYVGVIVTLGVSYVCYYLSGYKLYT